MKKWLLSMFCFVVFFTITGCDLNSSNEIEGCYSNGSASFCFSGSKVVYKNYGKSNTYYVDTINNSIYLEDEYDKIIFECHLSKNDSSSMRCSANINEKGLGYATYNLTKID